MELALITFEQVCILFLIILSGFVAAKTGVIKEEGKKVLSNLLVYLIMPGMILNSYMTKFDSEKFSNLMRSFGLSTFLLAFALAFSFLLLWKSKSKNKKILWFACSFSNAGYMGFPLIQALYGDEGMLYASAFITMFNVTLWTIGFIMMSNTVSVKQVVKKIASTPVLYAVVVGLVIYLFQIPVPNVIKQPIASIGNMNTPISMLIIGIVIAGSNLKKILANREIWLVIAIRLIVIPAISFGIFYLLGFGGMVASVVLIQAACPTAAITSVFAIQFGHDEDTAAGSVVMTTFCSIFSLTILAMLLQILG